MRDNIRFRIAVFKHDVQRQIERVQTAIVWHMPRWLIYWSAIRAGAHATTGKYGNEHPDSVSICDVLKRWHEPNEGR